MTEVVVRREMLIDNRSGDGKKSASGKRSSDDKIARNL